MSGVRISNDKALENAITTSAKNPRHCLCYKEDIGDRITWATTIVNSNKVYRLPLSKSAEYSIMVHEAIHQESIPRTYFKKRIILPIFDSSLIETEFLVEYNTQVRYFLETVAILGQVHVGSCKEFNEHLLNYIAGHEPHTLQLLNQIQDIIIKLKNKMDRRSKVKEMDILLAILPFIFRGRNIVEDRVFNRIRLLCRLPGTEVPMWKSLVELTGFLESLFSKRGFPSLSLFYLHGAGFYFALKRLNTSLDYEFLEKHIFGVISEFDPSIGFIIYTVNNLESLEGQKIEACFLKSSDNIFYGSIPKLAGRVQTEIFHLKKESRTKNEDLLEVMEFYRKELLNLHRIKKEIFPSCPGPDLCMGKRECLLEERVCSRFRNSLAKSVPASLERKIEEIFFA